MSTGLARTHAALIAALRRVPDLDVAERPGQALNPPAAYVGPPSLVWDGFDTSPRDAAFEVVLAVPATEEAIDQLYRLLPVVTDALDTVERDGDEGADATVKSAEPGVWNSGTQSLPCYFIRVEAALSDGSS